MDIYCDEELPSSPELCRRKRRKDCNANNKLKVYTDQEELLHYLQLLETHPVIRNFLDYDCCFRLADKYLIAMVFIYFKRAGLKVKDFTFINFFAALCIAHSMEEEDESAVEIYPWALGGTINLKELVPQLLQVKMHIWQAMDHRAVVSRYTCQQVISVFPFHSIWKRQRTVVHGGAPREYLRELSPPLYHDPRYDHLTNSCRKCRIAQRMMLECYSYKIK